MDEMLREIRRKLDMLIVIELASRGLNLKEIADILNVSERTIQRIISIRKIKQGGKHEEKKKEEKLRVDKIIPNK